LPDWDPAPSFPGGASAKRLPWFKSGASRNINEVAAKSLGRRGVLNERRKYLQTENGDVVVFKLLRLGAKQVRSNFLPRTYFIIANWRLGMV
jgi:hypothetical protein